MSVLLLLVTNKVVELADDPPVDVAGLCHRIGSERAVEVEVKSLSGGPAGVSKATIVTDAIVAVLES